MQSCSIVLSGNRLFPLPCNVAGFHTEARAKSSTVVYSYWSTKLLEDTNLDLKRSQCFLQVHSMKYSFTEAAHPCSLSHTEHVYPFASQQLWKRVTAYLPASALQCEDGVLLF